MKVALVHVRHAHSGGTERYLRHLSEHLAERGHDVTIVCRSHVEANHPRIRFEVLHGLAIGGAWRMWTFAREVERHVARSDYDVVLGLGKTWTHDVVRLGGGLHGTYLRLAHADTQSALERLVGKGRLKHRLALAIEERALAPDAARRFVTNSRMVARDLCATHGVPEEKVEVIYNGVDLERFDRARHAEAARALRAEAGLDEGDTVLLFLGTGYGRKGLDLVQEAFARFAPRHPRARLLVVGFDSGRARYERRGAELGIAERSRFLGGRLDAEVCYAASDVYCLPTRYDPFANSTLEALASGLPVVTSDANGGGELIEPGVQGDVVRIADGAERLADALEPWLDAERRADGARAARALAECHDVTSKLEAAERLLLEVVRSRPALHDVRR